MKFGEMASWLVREPQVKRFQLLPGRTLITERPLERSGCRVLFKQSWSDEAFHTREPAKIADLDERAGSRTFNLLSADLFER